MQTARVSRNLGAVHAAGAVSVARRLPVAGKIRPGIKVLTQSAAKIPGLAEKYAEGLRAGASFDEIAAALSAVQGAPKYPLTPKNVGYFTARQGDFSTPGAAAAIMEQYATVRPGDPEPRLYAFPIVFPSDDLDLVFRETFEAYRASELLRWSEPDPETGVLQCMKRVEVAPDRSARRRFGGRPTEAERACNPNDCDLFAKGECKHVASLNFWVPGVLGTGVIQLTFTSIYASLGIAETLDMVRAGLGRISGLYQGRPIFWLSKGREKVSKMNWETGKPEKVAQWIIRLEASGLDMVEVLTGPAPQAALPAPAAQAALPAPEPAAALEPEPEPEPVVPQHPPAVVEQRRHLAALCSTLGWDAQTRNEWISDRHPGTESVAMADQDALSAMIHALEGLAAMAAAPAAPATAAPAAAPAASDPASDINDPEVPF